MLLKKVSTPITKIKINGVFVKDVIAENEISKYFDKDIFDCPVNLFLRLYFKPFCLNPIKDINPLKYKFFYTDSPLVVMRYHDQNMGKAIKKNMEMHLICLDRLATSLDFPKDAVLPLVEYRAGIVFSNAWHCLRTNFEVAWAKKLILTSIKSTPKSLLSFRYFIGAMFILMPKKLIFYGF